MTKQTAWAVASRSSRSVDPIRHAPGNANGSSSRKKSRAVIILAATVIAFTLAGCTTSNNAEPAPTALTNTATSSASHSASPTPTPAPDRYKGADFQLSEALPANLQHLMTASLEEFAAAPKADQLAWASWAEQYKKAFIDYFYSVNPDPFDAPYELTKDADLQTIMKDIQYTDRLAANFGTGAPSGMDDNGALDTDMVAKLNIAHSLGGNFPYAQQIYVPNISKFGNGRALNVVFLARKDAYNMAEAAASAPDFKSRPNELINPETGASIPGYLFNFTGPDGTTFAGTVGVVEFTDFKGQTAYTFLSNKG